VGGEVGRQRQATLPRQGRFRVSRARVSPGQSPRATA
jgi:hypothetical protein